MTDALRRDLAASIDAGIVAALLESYTDMVTRYRKADTDGCLGAAGKFVENTLRAVEFLRTGKVLSEIKSPAATKTALENDTGLPESLRLLIPRIAMAMVYDIRSKRGAVHVKEIDPQAIDASLAVHAASWIVAELLRLFHTSDEAAVTARMAALMRTYVPFIETFENEDVVTRQVKCELELLLLLTNAGTIGMDRRGIGLASKFKPSTVTNTLTTLANDRLVHQTQNGRYYITGPGEKHASNLLAELP